MCAQRLTELDVQFQAGPNETEAQPSQKLCSDAVTC